MPAQVMANFPRTTPPAAVELTPNWQPLETKLQAAKCAEFMWMYRLEGVEYYKHIQTRLYLLLTAEGRCLVRTGNGVEEAAFEQEWKRVSGRRGGGDDDDGE